MTAADLTTTDRYEIRDLYARYAWARSTADLEAFEAAFAGDASIEDEGMRFEGPGAAGAYLRAWLRKPGAAGQQYWIMQQVIQGDSARCDLRAFLMTPMMNPIGTPSMTFYRFGYFTDELVKLDGRWRIAKHRIEQWKGDILDGFPSHDIVRTDTRGTA